MPASAAASLDGASPLSSASSSPSRLSLPVSAYVLLRSPFFVCWAPGGSQAPAGALSAATLLLYVAALPVVAACWARRAAREMVGVRTARRVAKTLSASGLPQPQQQQQPDGGAAAAADAGEAGAAAAPAQPRSTKAAGEMRIATKEASEAGLPLWDMDSEKAELWHGLDPIVRPVLANYVPAAW